MKRKLQEKLKNVKEIKDYRFNPYFCSGEQNCVYISSVCLFSFITRRQVGIDFI
jgi:hypothetical protein